MKMKAVALGLALAFLMLASACTSHAGDEFARVLNERWSIIEDSPDPDAPPPEPVEIVPYENGDFAPTLGFDLVSYPSHEGLLVQKFFALDGWFGQIEYDASDGFYPSLRVATTDSEDLHTTYPDLPSDVGEIRSIDNLDVRVRHDGGSVVMAYWVRGDFQYLLYLNRTEADTIDPVIEEFVTTVDSRMV